MLVKCPILQGCSPSNQRKGSPGNKELSQRRLISTRGQAWLQFSIICCAQNRLQLVSNLVWCWSSNFPTTAWAGSSWKSAAKEHKELGSGSKASYYQLWALHPLFMIQWAVGFPQGDYQLNATWCSITYNSRCLPARNGFPGIKYRYRYMEGKGEGGSTQRTSGCLHGCAYTCNLPDALHRR